MIKASAAATTTYLSPANQPIIASANDHKKYEISIFENVSLLSLTNHNNPKIANPTLNVVSNSDKKNIITNKKILNNV